MVPFGLTNAPAMFQALVNDVLWDMLNSCVFVYLDDLLIFSRFREVHVHHLQSVLQRLLENSLFVKAKKCEFPRMKRKRRKTEQHPDESGQGIYCHIMASF